MKKNVANCLADSFIRRTFVVRIPYISNAIMALFRGTDAMRSWGFAKHTGQRLFFCSLHNDVINTMRTSVNHANEANNSTLDRTVRAPKWVGVIGFILLLAAPLEGADFCRNAILYLLFNVPAALFCFYATGALDKLISTLKNK